MCGNIRMRERLVLCSESLECLNGKDIPQVERKFVKNLSQVKRKRKSQPKASKQEFNLLVVDNAKPIPHLPPYATQYRYDDNTHL